MALGADLTQTTFDAFMKTRFSGDEIADMILDGAKDPALEAIKRNTEGGGDGFKIPILTDGSARVGASFATVLGTDENTPGYAFTLTYCQLYSLASFPTPLVKATEGKEEAFESLVDTEMGRAVKGLNHQLAIATHRDGTGAVGQIALTDDTTLLSGVVTLANKSDAVLYTKGQILVAAATNGGALRTGTAKITGVSLANGTITFSTTPNSLITSLTGGDSLFVQGNANNNTANVMIEGFQSYVVPATAATSNVASLTNAFMGVVRSNNQGFLAGQFYDNTLANLGPGDTMAEALANAVSDIQVTIGAEDELDLVVMHPTDYRKIAASGSSKLVQLPATQDKAKISVSGLGLQTDYGVIPIKQSRYAVPGLGELWATKTWELVSTGKPDFKAPDGLTVRWNGSTDSFISWIGYYNVQMVTKAPGWNGLVRF